MDNRSLFIELIAQYFSESFIRRRYLGNRANYHLRIIQHSMKNIARCVGLENGQFIYAVIVQWAADRADSLMCAVLYEPCAAHSSVNRAQV